MKIGEMTMMNGPSTNHRRSSLYNHLRMKQEQKKFERQGLLYNTRRKQSSRVYYSLISTIKTCYRHLMDASDSESGSELDFANFDLTGVDFDHSDENYNLDQEDASALEMELAFLTGGTENKVYEDGSKRLCEVVYLVSNGRYVDALKSQAAMRLFTDPSVEVTGDNFKKTIEAILSRINSVSEFVEAEFIAIAAFSLFLQLNYTGPMFDDMTSLDCVNPHSGFAKCLNFSSSDIEEKKESITGKKDTKYHNSVLAELAVDGMWPCQVAEAPYLLLLSRHILATLSDPARKDWLAKDKTTETAPPQFFAMTSKLKAASIWSARAGVAHERLLLSREPTDTLWGEVEHTFSKCIQLFEGENNQTRATIFLEYGLACYHFDREKIGKNLFVQAMTMSGLSVEVTGAEGKRTKFQRKATAQMVVRATSANQETKVIEKVKAKSDEQVKSQMVELSEDNILFERVKFEEESENEVGNLTVLDQAILMALCLDVKNNNPSDGLTAEEMHAYLSRVLCHHDDWMVYSTALLERAWLEFEGNHTKERAILQMQALADQHTNRLTITQSTRKSVEESSPVQDRIRNLHSIAYPPRWHMLRDVAERYASLGIVTTAAEIFTEIEYWDEVVDCYRRAGKEKRAEEIVRERLNASETPRMWAALGDITSDPKHYEKAIALSQGRFVQAYISLGNHYFEKGLLLQAKNNYRNALKLRPLVSTVWFRVGTICMQLEEWDSALEAFSEVVQQQPEEAEAWANVAAVHMHNKHPAKAFPALAQSLKINRNNWRVWVSKLYTCLDLEKFDEAIQACIMLLDLRATKSVQGVPKLEENCVRAIVGGTISRYEIAKEKSDVASLDSARRSMTRVHELLERILESSNEPWVFETAAYFHEQIGQDTQMFENLMKEYRALSSIRAWEKDNHQVQKVCRVVSQVVHYQRDTKEKLVKSKFLLSGVIKRVKQARVDVGNVPEELGRLEALLEEITKEVTEQS